VRWKILGDLRYYFQERIFANMISRFHQASLIFSTIASSWLAMMGAHEFGHVMNALLPLPPNADRWRKPHFPQLFNLLFSEMAVSEPYGRGFHGVVGLRVGKPTYHGT
jgi:hypothetical protein